jgi:Plasmid pRiA4b ORF-3-like protein
MAGKKPVAAKKASAKSPFSFYQLKITLKGPRPPIWRRIQVPGLVTLGDLHIFIQVAMGWSNGHLHQFAVGTGSKEKFYGPVEDDPDDDFMVIDDCNMLDERHYELRKIAPKERTKFVYEYDFGDGWRHEVLVEQIFHFEPDVIYPRCIAGRRACPPEDCGGPWGYARLLNSLANPRAEESDELSSCLGKYFDPEFFDLAEVNASLNAMAGSA